MKGGWGVNPKIWENFQKFQYFQHGNGLVNHYYKRLNQFPTLRSETFAGRNFCKEKKNYKKKKIIIIKVII